MEIVPVTNRRLKNVFVKLPWQIYREDPYWVPPLILERKLFLSPRFNPFFKTNEATFFLAYQNGRPVGRISAHIVPRHNELYKDKTGFFGFFESIDDPEVAQRLLEKAGAWLKERGRDQIIGPMSFTMKEELGVLVDGFEKPPYLLNGHNPRYYPNLMDGAGLTKVKDWYAWHYDVGNTSPEALQLAEATESYPGLKIRTINMKKFNEEIRLLTSMFNEVWAQNWGYIPFSDEEVAHMAKELKPIIDPEMTFFAYVNGEPAALACAIPNINELLMQMNGRLFPWNWVKVLQRLWKKQWRSARMIMLGVRKPYRGTAVGALSVLMNVEMNRRGLRRGYKEAELSLTLEDNERVNRGIEFMGGKKYKTYRIYGKQL